MTNATLLVIATTLSGMIVFMKNDENTRRAATHAAMTINIGHLASHVDAYDSSGHFLTAGPLREGCRTTESRGSGLANGHRRRLRRPRPLRPGSKPKPSKSSCSAEPSGIRSVSEWAE